jgi:hypothetical protein
MGLRSIDLQINRGEGGQNEIGPELFRDIGVLRSSELLSAHRIDGAEQYFTRAIDYGYSFDPEEVIKKWGGDQIVGDLVHHIRALRPDVVLTMNIQGRGGDRAHEATTLLTREAYLAAGNPAMFPEQLKEGLRPWQPKKLYFSGGPGVIEAGGAAAPGAGRGRGAAAAPTAAPTAKVTTVNTSAFDPLLGRTYAEIGADARSYHKCQGANAMPPLPGAPTGRGGGAGTTFQLVACTIPGQQAKDETGLFDGIDTRISSLAQFAGPNPPAVLTSGLDSIASDALRARQAFDQGDDAATAAPIEAGLAAVRSLRSRLATIGLSDDVRFEIDFRLQIKEQDYQDAVLAAHDLLFDAVADDGLVVRGQTVRLSLFAVNRGQSEVGISDVRVTGFDGPANCTAGTARRDAVFTCTADVKIPVTSPLTSPYFSDDYWKTPSRPAINVFEAGTPFGVAFQPTPFRAVFHVKAGSVDVVKELPIQFRYVRDLYNGDKRMELNVVPALSVNATPPLVVMPMPNGTTARPTSREIHVSVTNGTKAAAQTLVGLQVPAGWQVSPASAPLEFLHEDESLSARFQVTAPRGERVGIYTLHAVATAALTGTERFANGYQAIEYPHVQRRQVIKPADVTFEIVDVKSPPPINVGYIVGVGDQVPAALQQLGAKVTFIEQDDLAWGDLSAYDVIITGVRAYERRDDLRAYNRRLLEYAERGGTVIVQYNKFEFNQAQYGPYPASVSANRVTDESAPVTILAPSHPVFNFPNKIGAATWSGWVQERGLYFLGAKDPKYVDLISMTDSFQDNPGEKLGSFVEGTVGKGRWIYLGLGLWRQLPAGTEGAYQLLANLISLPKAPR